MNFGNPVELVDWFESRERFLTPARIDELALHEAGKYPLSAHLVPVIKYMAGVEGATEGHFAEFLKKTPSGRDVNVSRFINRWTMEEMTHAQLLREFLKAMGKPIDVNNNDKVSTSTSKIKVLAANFLGENFITIHLVYGYASERYTATGYRQLMALAKHPVLTRLLSAIAREEEIHAFMYRNLAQIRLSKASPIGRQLIRTIVEKFWSPVGEGVVSKIDSHRLIKTLAPDLKLLKSQIDDKVSELFGFKNSKFVSRRVSEVLN